MAVIHLDDTLSLPDAPLFLDTSAWLPCLYAGEQFVKPVRAEIYTQLLKQQQEGKCQIRTCMTQLSEYWNVRLHKEHRAWQNADKNNGGVSFKNFRNDHMHDYDEAVQATKAEIHEILNSSLILNLHELISPQEVVDLCAVHDIEFNDALFFLICKKFHLTLVTEDNDFLPFVDEINIATTSDKYQL